MIKEGNAMILRSARRVSVLTDSLSDVTSSSHTNTTQDSCASLSRMTPTLPPSILRVRTLRDSLDSHCTPIDTRPLTNSVDFSTIEINEFPLVLGDHPCTSSGPPVAIDWKHIGKISLVLDAYEETRPPRRRGMDMRVPRTVRQDWLRAEGYSRNQLKEAEDLVIECRLQRESSVKMLTPVMLLEEATESMQRKMARFLRGAQRDRVLYDKWLEGSAASCQPAFCSNQQIQQKSL